MSAAPAVVIRCEFGQPLLVICEWDSALDDARMTAWFDEHEDYFHLVVSAIELAERERAA